MPRLPKFIDPELEAELKLTEDGRAEIARNKADNDRIWPKPELGDVLALKKRLEDDRAGWVAKVQEVRTLRFNEDRTPEKWAQRLNIPDERRFHTNNTGNEINRVVSMLGRNPARITIEAASDSNVSIQRAEKQARWCQAFLRAIERDPLFPVWAMGDDAAAETGLGGFEWFMNGSWEEVEELIDEIDPEAPDRDLDRQIEEAKKVAGLPCSIRPIDALSLLFDEDNYGVAKALIVERKHYAQVYQRLQETLSKEKIEELRLPPVGARSWPDTQRLIHYTHYGYSEVYDATPTGESGSLVEVIRYYDRRWMVEVVAGRIVECKEHHLPGVPVFPQLGKVTSNANTEWKVQGITFGMVSQELALNDAFTFGLDTVYSYSRPFPVVETSENGANILDKEGNPIPVNLKDPSQAPQLGPGQKIADAFSGFQGRNDIPFLSQIQGYFERSGVNDIASGESPGADPSGFALNTLGANATALYESILDNKVRTLGNILDFTRAAIKSTIRETVYLSVPTVDGQGVEWLGLGPDDIDRVPTTVFIDPKSDLQRLSISSWLSTANQQGYVSRRTVQKFGMVGIVEDPDTEDKAIILDGMKQQSLPGLIQAVIMRVQQDAFPELAAATGGPAAPPPTGGPQASQGPQDLQQQGVTPPRGVSVGNPAPKPAVAQANRGRAGQQPANQGVPALG